MSAPARSERMRRTKQRDTEPEVALRHGLHRLGLRYRLHERGLPGEPDLVFPRHGVALFVHGCFWHRHACSAGRAPTSYVQFWNAKLTANVRRDRRHARELRALGWRVLTVWECELKGVSKLSHTVARVAGRILAVSSRQGGAPDVCGSREPSRDRPCIGASVYREGQDESFESRIIR